MSIASSFEVRRSVALAVVLVALALAGCGGESDGATTAAPGSDTATTSTSPDVVVGSTAPSSAPAPDLAGTEWSVTEYTLENGSLTNLWPQTEITIQFEAERVLTGFSGCNDYHGTYEVTGGYDEFQDGVRDPADGQAIRIVDLAVTEKACTSPNNVMSQETEYLAAFQQVGRWVIVRGALSLRDADGFILVFADPLG